VGAFLGNKGGENVIIPSFKITIGDNSRKYTNKTVPAGTGWGWADCFDSLDDCKKALVDGALLVKVEVEMSGYRVVTRSNTGHNLKDKGRFASDIKGLRFDTDLADFLLKCGGKSFPCHKGILCARSAVFERMLAQGWDKAKNGEATVDDVEPEVLGMMLEFIYGGEVVSVEGRADELLYATDKYGL
jgi:hypothetical protein